MTLNKVYYDQVCTHLSHAGGGVNVEVHLLRQLQHRDVIVISIMAFMVMVDVDSRDIDCLLWQYSLPRGCSVVIAKYHLEQCKLRCLICSQSRLQY